MAQREPVVINPPDNTIRPAEAGYAADTGRLAAEFPASLGGGPVIVRAGDASVEWHPAHYVYRGADGMLDPICTAADVPATVEGSEARYSGAPLGIEEVYRVDGDRLKHIWRLTQPLRPPMAGLLSPMFAVEGFLVARNLTPRVGGIPQAAPFATYLPVELVNAAGEVVMLIPRAPVTDAAGAQTQGQISAEPQPDGSWLFAIAVPQAWLAEATYPVEIDPTIATSVSQVFSGDGGSGRKRIVHLSSGRLVVAYAASTGLKWATSTDGGVTWTTGTIVSLGAAPSAFALAKDIDSDTIYAWCAGSGGVYKSTDGTTWAKAGADIPAPGSWGQFVGLAVKGQQITLINVTAVKQFSYIRSTDGGATWGSWQTSQTFSLVGPYINYIRGLCVEQRTTGAVAVALLNSSSDTVGGTQYVTLAVYPDVTAAPLTDTKPVADYSDNTIGSYYQRTTDTVYIAWAIGDYTATGYLKRWSAAGGLITWTTFPVGSYQYCPALLVLSDDYNYVILLQDESYDKVYQVTRSGSVQTSIASVSTDISIVPELVNKTLYVVAWDTTSSLALATMTINQPALAPTGLACANFDATQGGRLSWTHNDPDGDPQAKYQVIIERVDTSAVVIDTGAVASANQYYDIAAGALVNGVQYRAKVRTADSSGTFGPYSSYVTWYTSARPTVTITTPGTTYDKPWLTPVGTYSDPESGAQSAGRWRLLTSDGMVLWDSGTLLGAILSPGQIPVRLDNGRTYKVGFTAWDDRDVASDEAVVTFAVSYTLPPQPVVTVTPHADQGTVTVSITNPPPGTGQPTVTHNDVYRRAAGKTAWTRIAAGVTINGTITDYTAGAGQWEYMARAYGDTDADIDSAPVQAQLAIAGVWLHDVADPAGTLWHCQYDVERSSRRQHEVTLAHYAGRILPVALMGESADRSVSIGVRLSRDRDAQLREQLLELYERQAIVCYRDGVGRRLFGVLGELREEDQWYGWDVTMTVNEVDYDEEV